MEEYPRPSRAYSPPLWQCLTCRRMFPAGGPGRRYPFCSKQCRQWMEVERFRPKASGPSALLGRRETDAEKYLRQKAELGGKVPRYQYVHEYPDYQPRLLQCMTCQRMFENGTKRRRMDCHFCSPICSQWMRDRQIGKYAWWTASKTWDKDECAACGVPIERYSSMRRYCSPKCKRSKSKRCGEVRKSIQTQVLARHGWWCHLCDDLIDPNLGRLDRMAMTMDHLIPVSLGGTDHPDNLKPAHRACNSSRGVKPISRAAK